MIVYMDGSSYRATQTKSQNDWMLSWGIVAHQDDVTTEIHGCETEVNKMFTGFHEMLAFAEAVKYVKQSKVPFDQVSFFTDDQWVVEASNSFQPCYLRNQVDADYTFRNRLMMFVNQFYAATQYDDMLECLKNARFTKVKGHASTVYNLRVDYLAEHARKLKLGVKEELLHFEAWLAKGFRYFDLKTYEWDTWFAPFATTLNKEYETS